MESDPGIPRLFAYPRAVHERRHGPIGYLDYGDYKPWLRDEFQFRCVYCLCRERWFPDGDEAFSVDHVQPQSVASSLGTTMTISFTRVATAIPQNAT